MSNTKQNKKRKRREKIRKLHLAHAKNQNNIYIRNNFIKVSTNLPDRNDREGWMDYNTITKDTIIQSAQKLYPRDKILNKFLRGNLHRKDLPYIETLLGHAAQKMANPPYFTPIIVLESKQNIPYLRIIPHKLKKHSTEHGTAWTIPKNDKSVDIVFHKNRYFQIAYSTHAMDRLYERIDLAIDKKLKDTYAIILLNKITYGKQISGLIPLHIKNTQLPFGYCPYTINENLIIATSFLLPCMNGTPEYNKLKRHGHTLHIEKMSDLRSDNMAKILKECQIEFCNF